MNQAQTSPAGPTGNPSSRAQDLAVLIGAGADASALAAYLDGVSPEARVREVQGLPASLLPPLFERCEKAQPLTLEDMVPRAQPALQMVIFAGINNLPLF